MPKDIMDDQSSVNSRRTNRLSSFEDFIKQQREKAPRRKPVRSRVESEKMRGTLFAKRNKIISIREAAARRVSIIINYKKVTTGEIKNYEVNPYSFRFRKLKTGRRKVLYAQDKKDKPRGRRKSIKNFVMNGIRNVIITDRKFRPVWRVEIRPKKTDAFYGVYL